MDYVNHKKNDYIYIYIYINFCNLSGKHYQENKEKLQNKACERYQNLSKKVTIQLWAIQNSHRIWNKYTGGVSKKIVEW